MLQKGSQVTKQKIMWLTQKYTVLSSYHYRIKKCLDGKLWITSFSYVIS